MTELDQALDTLRKDMSDPKSQSKYFDLFLNSTFFVPTLGDQELIEIGMVAAEGEVLPLVIESEGNDYLMLFDSKERMYAWAQAEVESVEMPGFVLAATSQAPLHWALNVGTDYSKQFVPDEIAWLRDVVERCDVEAAKGEIQSAASREEQV
ncbi:SseB family protein [Geobacter pelophilus]|jgi:hypothetical protein|uniref:SseB family protein n=1 Tax=Geoanaerobacter pelophilus TaxID=60036 RepID=A0AAW4L817_9BACT|nr:SseB family protein [Geoanaerobacter pelophilus]MBT0664446.1 SseB family protein [Geoanaerobacter pelophilus]